MYYYIMFFLGRVRRRFFNQIPENRAHYVKSRIAFIFDGVTATTIATLASGTYLSGFLKLIGISEVLNGIISALPGLVSVSQPMGAVFAQRRTKQKPLVCLGALLHRLMFTFMFFIPFLPFGATFKICAATAALCGAHFIAGFISPSANNWIMSLTPHKIRGSYFSQRELFTLISISVFSLLAGYILDFFGAQGDKKAGFMMLGIIMGLLTIINFVSLSTVMEPEPDEEKTKNIKLGDSIRLVLSDADFRPVLIMQALYNFAMQTAVPYHGIYLIGDLGISYTTVSIIAFVCSIEKAVTVRYWGRLADKTSWAYVSRLSIGIVAASHLVFTFLTKGNAGWLYPVNAVFSNIGWAAMGISILNVQYDFAPRRGRSLYLGISAAITGLIGFCGVFFGSLIMRCVLYLKPNLFGTQIKGQQLLMLLSGILLGCCALYIKNILEVKEKSAQNHNEMAV